MQRRSIVPLGETEMEVLQHVWDLGRASVGDVHERVLRTREVAYTTVMTVMKKLASKGYLSYVKEGNAYVYSAAQPPDEVRHGLLSDLLEKVFRGSPQALVQTLVRYEPLSEGDAEAIRQIVASMPGDAAAEGDDDRTA